MIAADFVGRKRELQTLEEAFAGPGSSFLPIYGRRRVGKSALILHFLRGKPGIYFVGKRAQAGLQIREFLRESALAMGEPLLAELAASDWKAALTAVSDRPREGRRIIVFDEFQWTAEASPELPSVLQELWDRRWKNDGKTLLILCGSYVGFMEREVLGRRSPLFGRRTGQIFLKPFGYREAAAFHPNYSVADQARVYFICGGVPLYLRYFLPGRSVEMNIEKCLLDPYESLYQEPEFLLREELREVESYYAVLLAVATGVSAHLEISQRTGIDNRALNYYLRQLLELGYLSRRHPLTGRRPPARYVRYSLEDPLLRFWFRFVYPNVSFVTHMGGAKAFRQLVAPELDAYWGLCFERLCREALPELYRREGVNAGFEVGEYWDRDTQIDLVGFRDDNWTDLGECKWGPVRSAAKLAKELDEKAQRYPNNRKATVARRIFTREPFRKTEADGIRWHHLEELYR